MSKQYLPLLVFWIAFMVNIHGQNQPYVQKRDSLLNLISRAQEDTTVVQLYGELSTAFRFIQPNDALTYARKALAISDRINYERGIALAYGDLFNGHFYAGSNSDSLKKYAQLLKDQFSLLGDSIAMIESYWDFAMYYGNIGQPAKEIESYQKALELIRKYQLSEQHEAALLTNIGGVFFSQYRPDKALSYFGQSLALEQSEIGRANALANTGNVYHYLLNKIDSAQIYYDEALEIFTKEEEFGGKAIMLSQKGSYLDTLGQLDSAYLLHTQALALAQKHEIGYALPDTYQGFASHYLKKKNFKKAIEYGEKAREEVEKQGNIYQTEAVFLTLNRCYVEVGDYKRAWEVGQDFKTLLDSINGIQMRNQVEELNTTFNVQQKESENEILRQTVKNRTITAIALILGLILIGSWAISVYRAGQQKQKYNALLELKVKERTEELSTVNNRLEKINKELRTFNYIASHDLKEPIRNIGNYIQLIERKLPTDLRQETNPYFNVINSSSSRLHTLLEDISKYSSLANSQDIQKEQINLNELLKTYQLESKETINKLNGVIVNNGLPTIESSPSLIFTIFKNLIENGLKFNESEAPTIELSTQSTEDYHKISFVDNGIGIDQNHLDQIFDMFKRLQNREDYEGTGLGLAIVQLLTDKIGGKIEVKSELQKGSQFILSIPRSSNL